MWCAPKLRKGGPLISPKWYTNVMSTVIGAANLMLSRSSVPLTNLKINKLLYYAYGVYLTLFSEHPFDERPEAWMYGPVFPTVYHSLKRYGSRPVTNLIRSEATGNTTDDRLTEVVDAVLKAYGHLPESALVQATHVPHGPWARVFLPRANRVIADSDITSYFKQHVVKA